MRVSRTQAGLGWKCRWPVRASIAQCTSQPPCPQAVTVPRAYSTPALTCGVRHRGKRSVLAHSGLNCLVYGLSQRGPLWRAATTGSSPHSPRHRRCRGSLSSPTCPSQLPSSSSSPPRCRLSSTSDAEPPSSTSLGRAALPDVSHPSHSLTSNRIYSYNPPLGIHSILIVVPLLSSPLSKRHQPSPWPSPPTPPSPPLAGASSSSPTPRPPPPPP